MGWRWLQEFNIEKLQIVEAEKKKIRQEFERKEKQVEVRRKMYFLLTDGSLSCLI
jgi:hypothetical protein